MEALSAMAPLVTAMAAAVHTMMRRRSTESPIGPASRAPAMNGSSWARLMAPTWRDEWVRRKT